MTGPVCDSCGIDLGPGWVATGTLSYSAVVPIAMKTFVLCPSCAELLRRWLDGETWQPIETAPKDGRDILVWDGYKRIVAHWVPWPGNIDAGRWSLSATGTHAEDGCLDYDPTHWMPLPVPPTGGVKP